jgi:hypothetical protein
MLERERKIAIRLLITGSGVRVPHNPLRSRECGAIWPYSVIVNKTDKQFLFK